MLYTAEVTEKPHILIVEDEETLASALGVKFGKHGFAATIARDGEEGLEKMREVQFSAIILDLLMPKKDGYTVLTERAQTKNSATPVYVLTALGQEAHLEKAKSLGAKRCYVKSLISIADVLKEIQGDLGMKAE
jgi:DNA-binding response OmpR family regulator